MADFDELAHDYCDAVGSSCYSCHWIRPDETGCIGASEGSFRIVAGLEVDSRAY